MCWSINVGFGYGSVLPIYGQYQTSSNIVKRQALRNTVISSACNVATVTNQLSRDHLHNYKQQFGVMDAVSHNLPLFKIYLSQLTNKFTMETQKDTIIC